MTEKALSPLRRRMIEDMSIRGIGEKAQSAYIRGVKDLARFLGRSPGIAAPEDLRSYQLHMSISEQKRSVCRSKAGQYLGSRRRALVRVFPI